jgi:multidrug efflux pump subunit AcrB
LTAAGSIETRGAQIFIRLDGAFDTLRKIRDTPFIAQGKTLKLSDVATVERVMKTRLFCKFVTSMNRPCCWVL